MRNKLMSRKFWISVAAFLGSIAASVAGLVVEEKWITIVGVVCGMLSAAIYAACEARCDVSCKDYGFKITYDDKIIADEKDPFVKL